MLKTEETENGTSINDKLYHYLSGVVTAVDIVDVSDQERICNMIDNFVDILIFRTHTRDDCSMNQVDGSHFEKTSSYQV